MFTPRASITSAEPFFELMLRLPCFATRTPAPATTNAVAVEMLNVALAEPPVPQVSTSASRQVPLTSTVELRWRFNGVAAARMASANPTISSTVSPFMCSATSRAAICASVHLPDRISAVTARAPSRDSDSRQSAMRCSASRIMGAGIRVALWADWAIGRRTDFRRLVLHRLRERQHVPNAPEGCHFIGRAEGNANIAVHRGKTTSDQHIIFEKVLLTITRSFSTDRSRKDAYIADWPA